MMKNLATILLALSACASESDGAFHIEGRLADCSKATHVVASNPTNATRVVVEMHADGKFDLALEPGLQWVVTFADASKTGKDMQLATLQANGIDAFAPQGPGSLDLGTVTMGATRAHGTADFADVIAALGLDAATATRLGRNDDLALRYSNPDIDNDGVLDALQAGHDYRLDIGGHFRLQRDGRELDLSDLVRGNYSTHAKIKYSGTSIKAYVPREMGMNMPTSTVTFDQPFYGTANGPATEMIEPGTRIGQPHIKFGAPGATPVVGVVSSAAQDTPTGTYEFGFDNGQLTFSEVFAPSRGLLQWSPTYAVPFVRIHATNAACTTNCDLESIEIDWKRMTPSGWASTNEPTAARIEILATVKGQDVFLAADLAAGTSALAWTDMPVANTGITWNELSYVSTASICYFAVSYESELGMKMTSTVANPSCR